MSATPVQQLAFINIFGPSYARDLRMSRRLLVLCEQFRCAAGLIVIFASLNVISQPAAAPHPHAARKSNVQASCKNKFVGSTFMLPTVFEYPMVCA